MFGEPKVQRGRKSAAATEIAMVEGLTDIVPRPHPPAELSDEEAVEWVVICNAVPAGYFPSATHMVVVQYCRHVVVARHLSELIHKCERGRRFDLGQYRRLCSLQQRETLAIYGCLRSMRLTHLATYSRDRSPIPTEMPKPWES